MEVDYLKKTRRQTEELIRLFCLQARNMDKDLIAIECLMAIQRELSKWAGKLHGVINQDISQDSQNVSQNNNEKGVRK